MIGLLISGIIFVKGKVVGPMLGSIFHATLVVVSSLSLINNKTRLPMWRRMGRYSNLNTEKIKRQSTGKSKK